MEAMVFAPLTGATRIFSSYNMAEERFHGYRPIVRAADMLRWRPHKLRLGYENLLHWGLRRDSVSYIGGNWYVGDRLVPHPEGHLDEETLSKLIFEIGFEIGDKVKGLTGQNHSNPGFVINIEAAKTMYSMWENKELKVPKQAAALADFFASEGYDFYTKEEMQRATRSLNCLRRLSTKQNPWRIFRYYKQVLIDHKVIQDNTKEESTDDQEG